MGLLTKTWRRSELQWAETLLLFLEIDNRVFRARTYVLGRAGVPEGTLGLGGTCPGSYGQAFLLRAIGTGAGSVTQQFRQ